MARKPAPQPAEPAGAPPADPFAHANDPHWGKGGRYIIDPATGQRIPAPPESFDSPAQE